MEDEVQERVRVFVWIVAHEKLLTNLERCRMATSPTRARCNQTEEGSLHAVRDSMAAKKIWNCLILRSLVADFFPIELKEWIVWLFRGGWNGGTQPR